MAETPQVTPLKPTQDVVVKVRTLGASESVSAQHLAASGGWFSSCFFLCLRWGPFGSGSAGAAMMTTPKLGLPRWWPCSLSP